MRTEHIHKLELLNIKAKYLIVLGTGGDITGDHVHLETGKGQVNLSDYLYHFLDSTSCKRIKPDEALFINDTTIISSVYDIGYMWQTYQGETITSKNSVKWLKRRAKNIRLKYWLKICFKGII